ncbi:RimK family protein [Acidovorax sp. SUPP3434]|uniref:RimK family protein n=1 Tax=Acidovorax sp. SUPP3434 TaxID=2920880 RepID=UPI0023DE332A|nr:RimK family protein [Acidovorax sp. SUPP3434]GKT01047.1 RimK family protein [Acidovorax sp. SUPP3434]
MTSEHVIVVERRSDFRWSDPGVRIVTAEAFIAEEPRPRARARKVTNLCRNYSYLGMGYYCSLLAEARGDRVTPSVETIVALQRGKQQAASLAALDRLIGPLDSVPQSVSSLTLDVFFGRTEDAELTALARKGFELFRCPLLRLHLQRREPSPGWHVAALQSLDPRDVDAHRDGLFDEALAHFTRRHWRPAAPVAAPRMDLAILHDPNDPLPPSSRRTLQKIVDVGHGMGIAVELIEKKDFSRLTQFDALFIRETTAVNHHTFQFAKKAAAEGMPVIDDPVSILRCTNKAYLAELLKGHGIATPRTHLVSRRTLGDLPRGLAYPVVVKVPDGSFSRSVKKAENAEALHAIAREMLRESGIILLQEFMYTDFDWRIGLVGGEPLFAAKYYMCDGHWQILQHGEDGGYVEGRTQAVSLDAVPPPVLQAATRAARLVGNGFYGVDLKCNAAGAHVIEINDNPNLDAGVEDALVGDALYRTLLGHLLARMDWRLNREGAAPLCSGPSQRNPAACQGPAWRSEPAGTGAAVPAR